MSTAAPHRESPPSEVRITADLVRGLLERQQPDLVHQPLGERHEGWDNVTWRLGTDLAVRLPRRQLGADLVGTELDWLPRISAEWTFAAPVPVRAGEPDETFPWRWSIVPWIDGVEAFVEPLSADGAGDLGRALAHLHRPAGPDVPRNPYRSAALTDRAEVFDRRLADLADDGQPVPRVNESMAREIFGTGAAAARGPLTWTHLDLHGRNVLTRDGRLAGILDWGDAGAGDPATDLGQAWTLVGSRLFGDLLTAYLDAGGAAGDGASRGLPEAAAARVKGEALTFAVMLAHFEQQTFRAAGWGALADLGVAAR